MESKEAVQVPDYARDRLSKVRGHLNASERKLESDPDRGLWSARQAKAQLAEVWIWLNDGTEFEFAERHLSREATEERLAAFAETPMTEAVRLAWSEVASAEHAIVTAGFTNLGSTLTNEERQALTAGLARKAAYFDALRKLAGAVEAVLAQRYIDLAPGDWVSVKGGLVGRVVCLRGLRMHLFSLTARQGFETSNSTTSYFDRPQDAVRLYTLALAKVTRVDPPAHPPITEPSYYWMVYANDRLRRVAYLASDVDWSAAVNIESLLRDALNAIAKAWWAAFQPCNPHVSWQSSPAENVERLQDTAPAEVSSALISCLNCIETLTHERTRNSNREVRYWRSAVKEMLPLFEAARAVVEQLAAPHVDLALGDWVSSRQGYGCITARNGNKLVVLGHQGFRELTLFRDAIHRCRPFDGMPKVEWMQRWCVRWRWFALNPQACLGRGLCPCCGLPGVEMGEQPCRLCGWIHDGGDFNSTRRISTHPNLNLDLARRRLESLGYAAVVGDSATKGPSMRDWRIAVRRKMLVDGLDALVDSESEGTEPSLAAVESLWADYDAVLQDIA